MKKWIDLAKKTLSEWSEDNVSRHAAALSYYTVFSLAPLLVLVISLLGFLGPERDIQRLILDQVEDLAGQQGAGLLEGMIAASRSPSTGVLATILGTITLLIGALGVFGELQGSFNAIWDVRPKPVEGFFARVKTLLVNRLVSFTMVLVIGFLLLVSLVLSAGLASLQEYASSSFPITPLALMLSNFAVSIGVITALFALIFKFLPDAVIAWKDVWLGAFVTALLFSIGKFLIGFYLGGREIGSAFGAAGSLAILLIWIYYSGQILFLGAEFTQVYANQLGSKILPAENAEWAGQAERAERATSAGQGALQEVARRSDEPAGRLHPEHAASWRPRTGAMQIRQRASFAARFLYAAMLVLQFLPALREIAASRTRRSG